MEDFFFSNQGQQFAQALAAAHALAVRSHCIVYVRRPGFCCWGYEQQCKAAAAAGFMVNVVEIGRTEGALVPSGDRKQLRIDIVSSDLRWE